VSRTAPGLNGADRDTTGGPRMLIRLSIRDIVLIDRPRKSISPAGLSVLTGETGAGKIDPARFLCAGSGCARRFGSCPPGRRAGSGDGGVRRGAGSPRAGHSQGE